MSRKTYGDNVKARVKRLFELLLSLEESDKDNYGIEFNWQNSAKPKLVVKTNLIGLEALTKKDGQDYLDKNQIREALHRMEDFLGILEKNQTQKEAHQGIWRFTFKPWFPKEQFDIEWEKKRPDKSKEQAASAKQKPAKTTKHKTSILSQLPPLPSYYVDRPKYSQNLKARLLEKSSDPRTLVVTAIHGLGSVGKSTLVTALVHDPEVQNHFNDGILWATLGQKPNLLPLLSTWIQALGDHNFKPTSVETASAHLGTLVYDKSVLLVIDDAWNSEDAKVFSIGKGKCQVLVTTREEVIVDTLNAQKYSLDVMTPSQSMELVTKKLGRELTDSEVQDAKAFAKEVGYLPLALELATAQVANDTAWKVLLQDMQQEVARLKTLGNKSARDITDPGSLKKLNLEASLNLSVQRLEKETRKNFIWLGILPEDVNITPKMTATLWDIDERDAEDELVYFRKKALLLPGTLLADGTPTYRLHDLFHDLACNLLTAPVEPKREGDLQGLGKTLPDAHAAFLEKYKNLTDKNLWHTLKDDGYIHKNLS